MCLCGEVEITLRTEDPAISGFCHCWACRRAHSAPLYQVIYADTANICPKTGSKREGEFEITITKGFDSLRPGDPGPGNPNQSGNCIKILKSLYKELPILGVCLGHQIIGQVFGSKIIQAKNLVHGKTSKIISKKIGILKNLPKTFEATRYHSLIIDKKTLSNDLLITAETNDGVIMGIQHKKFNIHGVQFHPESIKTPIGIKILNNF